MCSDKAPSTVDLINYAMEIKTPIAEIEPLLQRLRAEKQERQKQAYFNALRAFRADAPPIQRDAEGEHGPHESLSGILQTIEPHLQAHGLTHHWETERDESGLVVVTCVITHEQGHQQRVTLRAVPDSSEQMNSIQAVKSSGTYLQRITLLAALGLAPARAEAPAAPQSDLPERIPGWAARLLDRQTRDHDIDAQSLLQAHGTERFEDLPWRAMPAVLDAITESIQ